MNLLSSLVSSGFLVSASAVFAADQFAVARTCINVSGYVNEISSIVLESTGKEINNYGRLFDVAYIKHLPEVQLFSIVAGPKSQFFAFEDMDGVYGIEKLARTCIGENNCSEEVVSVIRGFSHFLIEACRQDYTGGHK